MAIPITVPADTSALTFTVDTDSNNYRYWKWAAFTWRTSDGSSMHQIAWADWTSSRRSFQIDVAALSGRTLAIQLTHQDDVPPAAWQPTVSIAADSGADLGTHPCILKTGIEARFTFTF